MAIQDGQGLWYKPPFGTEWEHVTVAGNPGAYEVDVIRDGEDYSFSAPLRLLSTTPNWSGAVQR